MIVKNNVYLKYEDFQGKCKRSVENTYCGINRLFFAIFNLPYNRLDKWRARASWYCKVIHRYNERTLQKRLLYWCDRISNRKANVAPIEYKKPLFYKEAA